ncbi:LicD family protein [Ruminococcus sp.]|uniref:LicD family protein n=1 Tax=Ruminococcus sp. TaxID=41978 RepID=UPI001B6AE9B4|nr:LicD family protein [Ruminococcus sp.]MBP5433109.1 LicD family protein [Ruminococcus sp.]
MRNLELEDVKRIAAGILKRIDKACRENGLTYFVMYGTLLGVVRHKGFIPWDDDIDIVMPRKDFNKLSELFRNDEYLRFITIENTKDTIYPHGKMVDTRTELYLDTYRHVEGYGIGVDVFPMDYMPDDPKKRKLGIKYALFLRRLIEHSAATSVTKSGSFGRNAARQLAFWATRCLNTQKLIKKLDRLNLKNKKSGYMGSAWDVPFPVNELFDPVDLPFEDFQVMAPKDYDHLLRLKFGNYMKLPPKSEQVPKHHYKCWLKDGYENIIP